MKDHHSTDEKNGKGNKESCNTHAHVEGGIEIDFSQDLKKQKQTEHDETTAYNKKQLWWTRVTAGLVFVYALFTFWQGCIGKMQLATMQNTARPWVFISSQFAEGVSADGRGMILRVNAVATNTSTIPAVNVETTRPQIEIGKSANVGTKCNAEYSQAAPIAPVADTINGRISFPSVFTDTIGNDEWKNITSTKEDRDIVIVTAKVKYSGPNGGNYETRFCGEYLPFGDLHTAICHYCNPGMK